MKKIKVTIEGMHCAACGANVERELKKTSGVHDVRVSVMTHKGFIETDDSVSEDSLKDAVAKVGYTVVKFG